MSLPPGDMAAGSCRYWWACRCGSWMWADQPRCACCKATAPKWTKPFRRATSAPARQRRADAGRRSLSQPASGASGNSPRPVTIGDFICVPSSKRERRAAVRASVALAKAQKEAEELKAKLGNNGGGAAEAVQPPSDADGDALMEQPRDDDGKRPPDGGEGVGLAGLSDEKLAIIVKTVENKPGMPGREAFLAEHQRRKDAKAASTPTHVRVKQGTDKWRRAEEKAGKAEAALQAATEAVEQAKKDAERTLAEVTAKAAAAAKHLESMRKAAAAAREVVDQAVAGNTAVAKSTTERPASTVAFHPGSRAWEGASIMCGFLTAEVLQALSAAGMPPEKLAAVQAAQADMRQLAEERTAAHSPPATRTDTPSPMTRPAFSSPGAEHAHRRICEAAAMHHATGHASSSCTATGSAAAWSGPATAMATSMMADTGNLACATELGSV